MVVAKHAVLIMKCQLYWYGLWLQKTHKSLAEERTFRRTYRPTDSSLDLCQYQNIGHGKQGNVPRKEWV